MSKAVRRNLKRTTSLIIAMALVIVANLAISNAAGASSKKGAISIMTNDPPRPKGAISIMTNDPPRPKGAISIMTNDPPRPKGAISIMTNDPPRP